MRIHYLLKSRKKNILVLEMKNRVFDMDYKQISGVKNKKIDTNASTNVSGVPMCSNIKDDHD